MAKELVISIGWEYFLGIMGGLLVVAWYASGKFSKIETIIENIKETLHDVKTQVDNIYLKNPAFGSKSPVNLTKVGEEWLEQSGLKKYIDDNKIELMKACEEKKNTNPYEIQKHIFKLLDELKLEDVFENQLKEFAFQKGTTMNIIRRVGAIYLRNLCLDEYKMDRGEIDKHDPEKKKPS